MTDWKFRRTRMRPGDYLQLSNDMETLWRVSRYREDGSATDERGRPVTGEFWGLWRFAGMIESDVIAEDFETSWDMYAQGFPTRAAALAYALDLEDASP